MLDEKRRPNKNLRIMDIMKLDEEKEPNTDDI